MNAIKKHGDVPVSALASQGRHVGRKSKTVWPKEYGSAKDTGWVIGVLDRNSFLNAVVCIFLIVITLRGDRLCFRK